MPSPESIELLERMNRRAEGEVFESWEKSREWMERFAHPPDDDVTCEYIDAGAVRYAWVKGANASDARTILYFHGGGYCIGSIRTHLQLTGWIAKASAARLFSVEYRLAPEHPFPAAYDDCVESYRYLLRSGVAPESIVLAGDSAGGALTAAVMFAARDQGLPMPAGGVMICPSADHTRVPLPPERLVIKTSPASERMAGTYLNGADPKTPTVSPFYGDLTGLSPLLIQVSSGEPFYEDSVRFTEKAHASGVTCTLQTWDGLPHVWHLYAWMLPEGREAIEKIGEFVQGVVL